MATRASVAVVGGGIAGLSAAYHLRRRLPAGEVVVLEADRVGAGATGRSTGMLGPGVGGSIVDLRRRLGDERAGAAFAATLTAVRRLVGLVRAEGLDCGLAERAQVHAALDARGARGLEARAAALTELGFEVPLLDAARVRGVLGAAPYRAGLRFADAALVDPDRLCLELARVLRARGVRVLEGTRVAALHPGVADVSLETSAGVVRADRVVLATNAYTPGLGRLAGQVVPLHTHAVLTRRLRPDEVAALAWPGREAIVGTRRFFEYFRLTSDDRLLFGGGPAIYRRARGDRRAGATHAARPRVWRRLEREIARLLPPLAGVRIARRWAGPLGFTRDQLPIVGPLPDAPRVLASVGWCGHGLALSALAGEVVAAAAAGEAPPLPLPGWRGRAPRLPADPVRGLGLACYLAGLNLADRLQTALPPAPAPQEAAPCPTP